MLTRPAIAAVLVSLIASGAASARLPRGEPDPAAKARYDAARAYSEARGGLALVVIEQDQLVYVRAPAGRGVRVPHPIYSGVKGLLCPLAMAALERMEAALDDPAGPTFAAAAGAGDVGAPSVPVRVRDLLQMTSGLDDARWWAVVESPDRVRRDTPDDRYAFAASLGVMQAPGSLFQYSAVHGAALGAFLVRHALDPKKLLGERVLRPLGVRPRAWISDGAGQPILTHGMSLTPEQWARIGMLMRDDGRFGEKRLFAPGRLAACLRGSEAMPAYGLGWWLNAPLNEAQLAQVPPSIREHLAAPRLFAPGPPDLFAAIGSHDQRLYVIPSRGLVIVRMARRHEGEPFLDAEFLALIVSG